MSRAFGFPPVVVLVWAIGVYALARSMLGGTRAPWAAAWLFVGLNWIEQDYFSPQAIGIVLLLTVLTFALGPLVVLACRKGVMGQYALRGAWAWAAISATVGIVILDGYLLVDMVV